MGIHRNGYLPIQHVTSSLHSADMARKATSSLDYDLITRKKIQPRGEDCYLNAVQPSVARPVARGVWRVSSGKADMFRHMDG